MLEQAINSIASALPVEDNIQLQQRNLMLTGEHNEFMRLTSNRYTSLLQKGKVGSYHRKKVVVFSGLNKIHALLLRAYK